jgi:hypothetical protein
VDAAAQVKPVNMHSSYALAVCWLFSAAAHHFRQHLFDKNYLREINI